ncbi:MAG: TIGR00730 family Rossman fold protein [Desulfonatronovibrionaceae bacterium]
MKSICVYCGSSPGARPDYIEAARELGKEMGRRDIGLVYGGASIGVMGAIADSVLESGGTVTGVIPRALMDKEISHGGLTRLKLVETMHERKMAMAKAADGFIALPGGLGTIEELFEILTWSQLRLHQKPCAVMEVSGYFQYLLRFLRHAEEEEFVKPAHRGMLITGNDPAEVLNKMADYTPSY